MIQHMIYRALLVILSIAQLAPVKAQGQADYFVEAVVTNYTPYIGQQIVYTFRLYTRQISRTNRGTIVDPAFDGFWQQEFGADNEYSIVLEGENYQVKERQFVLYPSHTGAITIEPSIFVIPDDPFRAGEALYTEAVTLQVQSLPPVPADVIGFEGAVGQFEMQPTIDRQTVVLGEPIRLSLTLRGTGNLEQLPTPALSENAVWRVVTRPGDYQTLNAGGSLVGEKTFQWSLTPLLTGSQLLPVISVAYFDPLTQSYRSLTSGSLAVEVLADESIPLAAPAGPGDEMLRLKPVPTALNAGGSGQGFLFWMLWLIPPLAAGYLWLRVRQDRYRNDDAAAYRQSEALKRARKAILAGVRAQSYAGLRAGLFGYIADKSGRSIDTLYSDEVELILNNRRIDPGVRAQLMDCLEQADQGLYAPSANIDAAALGQNMLRLLSRIDAQWKS